MIRNRLPFCAFLVCLFGATVRGQGILVWNDTTGLPTCAYKCNDLYAVQFECSTGAGGLSCFCGSAMLAAKPVGWGCDDVCTGGDRERVANFLGATCEGAMNESRTSTTDMGASASTTLTTVGTPTPTSESTGAAGISTLTSASAIPVTSTAREPIVSTTGTVNRNVSVETAHSSAHSSNAHKSQSDREDQANKALRWWRKNWPYFFLTLLLVILIILAAAFAGAIHKRLQHMAVWRRMGKSSDTMAPPESSADGDMRSSTLPITSARPCSGAVLQQSGPGIHPGRSIISYHYDYGLLGPPSPLSSGDPVPSPVIRALPATRAEAMSLNEGASERTLRGQHGGTGWLSMFSRKNRTASPYLSNGGFRV